MNRAVDLCTRLLNRCAFIWRSGVFKFERATALAALSLRLLLIACKLPLPRQYLVLNTARYDTGMFSQMATVLGLLEHYDNWKDKYAGLHVDFGDRGLYFDPEVGRNWWTYFLEPIEVGVAAGASKRILSDRLHIIFASRTEETMPRKKGADLIDRYFLVNSNIQAKVEAFAGEHFGGSYVIGIHYRGTDKEQEAGLVAYEAVIAAVRRAIAAAGTPRYMLFLATDEQPFLDRMLALFPEKLAFCEAFRSIDGTPTDTRDGQNYKKGEEAVMDCLLLSQCDVLIRTTSNLSLFSTLFGPEVPEILLTANASTRRTQ